jgi:DNA invertase Pin-like site-specific DNA recombinase
MARPSKRDQYKAAVIEAHAKGGSTREIAKAAGVSHMTVSRWIKDADVAPAVAARAAALAANVATEPDATDSDADFPEHTPEMLRYQIAEARKRTKASERAGDYKSSTQNAKLVADLTNTLLRAERGETEDADVLKISRREIDQAMARVSARVRAIVERPMLCAHCSRKLSVEFGTK